MPHPCQAMMPRPCPVMVPQPTFQVPVVQVTSWYNPIQYNGANQVILEMFRRAFKIGTDDLGCVTLYHATSLEIAFKIMCEGFRPGSKGLFGAGIYFADSKAAAAYKSAHSNDAFVVAQVYMGKALIVEGPRYTLNEAQILELGCDSVKGRKTSNSDWEYVVYHPMKVRPLRIETP